MFLLLYFKKFKKQFWEKKIFIELIKCDKHLLFQFVKKISIICYNMVNLFLV